MQRIMQSPIAHPPQAITLSSLTIELQFRYKGSRGDGVIGTTIRYANDMTNPGLKYAQDVVQDLLALGAAVELPDIRMLIRENARCRCFWETAMDSSLHVALRKMAGAVPHFCQDVLERHQILSISYIEHGGGGEVTLPQPKVYILPSFSLFSRWDDTLQAVTRDRPTIPSNQAEAGQAPDACALTRSQTAGLAEDKDTPSSVDLNGTSLDPSKAAVRSPDVTMNGHAGADGQSLQDTPPTEPESSSQPAKKPKKRKRKKPATEEPSASEAIDPSKRSKVEGEDTGGPLHPPNVTVQSVSPLAGHESNSAKPSVVSIHDTLPQPSKPVAHPPSRQSTPDFLAARLLVKTDECKSVKAELDSAVKELIRLRGELARAGQVRAHAESIAVTQRREHERVVADLRAQLDRQAEELARSEQARHAVEGELRRKSLELAELEDVFTAFKAAGISPSLIPTFLDTFSRIGHLTDLAA